jgi:hypothetical protein
MIESKEARLMRLLQDKYIQESRQFLEAIQKGESGGDLEIRRIQLRELSKELNNRYKNSIAGQSPDYKEQP